MIRTCNSSNAQFFSTNVAGLALRASNRWIASSRKLGATDSESNERPSALSLSLWPEISGKDGGGGGGGGVATAAVSKEDRFRAAMVTRSVQRRQTYSSYS